MEKMTMKKVDGPDLNLGDRVRFLFCSPTCSIIGGYKASQSDLLSAGEVVGYSESYDLYRVLVTHSPVSDFVGREFVAGVEKSLISIETRKEEK